MLAIPRSGEDARVDWTIEQDDLAVYGECEIYGEPQLKLNSSRESEGTSIGPVNSLAWTSDGCGLAVGWERGMGLWSISGRQTFFTAGPDMTRETIENSGDKIGGDSEEKSSGSGAQHLVSERPVTLVNLTDIYRSCSSGPPEITNSSPWPANLR